MYYRPYMGDIVIQCREGGGMDEEIDIIGQLLEG